MVIHCLPRSFRLAVWGAVLVLASCLIPAAAAAADPFADSFASGGKAPPAHRTTKRKKATRATTRPTTKRAKPARPAHSKRRTQRHPGRFVAPSSSQDTSPAEAPAAEPQREEPARDTSERETVEDAPRSRRDEAEPAPAAERSEEAPADQAEAERPAPRRVPARRASKRHKRAADDESGSSDDKSSDEEDDATPYAPPTATQPVILPRAFTLQLGGSMMGRSFHFDIPLQRESSFPRVGYLAAIETFPLKLLGPGWLDGFGFAASYVAEYGNASVSSNGMSASNSVKQSRWNLDLRYAFELGGYVVVAPDIGLAHSSFTMSTNMPIMASACGPTSTAPCIPNADLLMAQFGAHLRVAVAREIAVTMDGAFLEGLSVGNKPANEIGYEAGTSANGFNVTAGGTYMLMDFLALHAEIPFTRLTYTFHNPPNTPYKTATETYYGLNVSLAVFTD
jgi:hypothetical protein